VRKADKVEKNRNAKVLYPNSLYAKEINHIPNGGFKFQYSVSPIYVGFM